MRHAHLDDPIDGTPPAEAGTRLSTGALLRVWDEGCVASPGERGLLLLGLAAPELSAPARASLSVGLRDARLLDLLAALFGEIAASLATCPGCGETLEFDVPLAGIRSAQPAGRPDHDSLAWDGQVIAYRLPCAGDLAALGRQDLAAIDAADALARRCVLSVDGPGSAPDGAALTDGALAALQVAIAAHVAEADPQAVVTLDFACPSCAAPWQAPFDVVDFLWCRLDWWLDGLLRETHVLATQYGWSERDIVALSPTRRRRYLDLIGA